jgi:hypothetical protein
VLDRRLVAVSVPHPVRSARTRVGTGVPGLCAPGMATGAKGRPADRSWAAGLLTDRGGTTMDYLATMTTQVPTGVADSTSKSTTS